MQFLEVFVFCAAALGSSVLSASISGGHQDEHQFAVIPPQPASQASEVIIAQSPEQKEVSPGSSIPDSAPKLKRSADSNGHLYELNEDVESAPRVVRAPQFGNQLLSAASNLFGGGGYPGGYGGNPGYGGGYNPGYGGGYNPGYNGGGYPGGAGGYGPAPYNGGGSGSNSFSQSSAQSHSVAGGLGLGPLGNVGGSLSTSSAQSGAGSNAGGYGRR